MPTPFALCQVTSISWLRGHWRDSVTSRNLWTASATAALSLRISVASSSIRISASISGSFTSMLTHRKRRRRRSRWRRMRSAASVRRGQCISALAGIGILRTLRNSPQWGRHRRPIHVSRRRSSGLPSNIPVAVRHIGRRTRRSAAFGWTSRRAAAVVEFDGAELPRLAGAAKTARMRAVIVYGGAYCSGGSSSCSRSAAPHRQDAGRDDGPRAASISCPMARAIISQPTALGGMPAAIQAPTW